MRDQDGNELGTLRELYLDSQTSRPAWAGVKRGRLRTTETIVPLTDVSELGDDLALPFDRARFDDAPDVDPDVELTEEQERRCTSTTATSGRTARGRAAEPTG